MSKKSKTAKPTSKQVKKIQFLELIDAIKETVDESDNTGCNGNLTVTSHSAVQRLRTILDSMCVNEKYIQMLDAIQSVCLLADDFMKLERKKKFDGWDSDDVTDSNVAIKMVKDFFNVG